MHTPITVTASELRAIAVATPDEDAAPTPPDWMLTDEALIAESMGFDPRQDIASEDAAADYSLDIPTSPHTPDPRKGSGLRR